ncbi:hypothetical protein VTO73DRAFT_12673 [Trametes versicolor]
MGHCAITETLDTAFRRPQVPLTSSAPVACRPAATTYPDPSARGASLAKTAGWPSEEARESLPVYSVTAPRPPPLASFNLTSSALSDDGLPMSDSPFYEKFPATPSSAGSDLSDLSQHDASVHGPHAV